MSEVHASRGATAHRTWFGRAKPLASVSGGMGVALSAVAVAWWLVEVTRSWGGWDGPAVTVGAVLIAVAALVVRPDRVLPVRVAGLAAAISVCAVVVPVVAPVGWAAATGAAPYVCAAWLAVLVAATVVRWPASRSLLLALVVASAPIEFMSGWIAWWGGRNASLPMDGTFYWYNPYAAFLVPGGLLGLALWIWGERVFALLGILAFGFATVGIVYSTSRASLITYVVGIAALAVLATVERQRLRATRQLVIGLLLAAGAAVVVGGPPFFPHRSSPFAGTVARGATQPLAQNARYRLDFWREALTVFFHHPFAGGGYKSLVALAMPLAPKSWPLSPFAHNGYLQALSDGGVLLGLPFLVSILLVAWLVVRLIGSTIRSRDPSVTRYALPVALACVLLHSGVGFDWIYPASMSMAGILVGLVVGEWLTDKAHPHIEPVVAPEPHRSGWQSRVVLAGCVLAGVGMLSLSAVLMRNGDHTYSLTQSGAQTSHGARAAP